MQFLFRKPLLYPAELRDQLRNVYFKIWRIESAVPAKVISGQDKVTGGSKHPDSILE